MPRKRYIKPGFFKNEELAELPPLVRIFFQGLWCWADREGRLEDRPKRLKSEIMPYDNLNAEGALVKLQSAGFIIRYTCKTDVSENKIIQIVNFKKHQDIHVNEAASNLPHYQSITEKKHGADTVQEQFKEGANTPYTSCNSYTSYNSLTLEEEVVVEGAQKKSEKQQEFEAYVDEFDKNNNASMPESAYIPDKEKEKSSAQKEKALPTLAEAMQKVAETAHWRNTLEHWLKQKDVTLTPDVLTELEAERTDLFKIFYEQKEDEYTARGRPTYTSMAQNFYFWVNIHKNSTLKQLKNALNANTTTKSNWNRARTEETKRGVEALMQRSGEFLRKSSG